MKNVIPVQRRKLTVEKRVLSVGTGKRRDRCRDGGVGVSQIVKGGELSEKRR